MKPSVKIYKELLDALITIKDENVQNLDANDIVLAAGIVASSLQDKKFVFMLHFLCELLNLIELANQILIELNKLNLRSVTAKKGKTGREIKRFVGLRSVVTMSSIVRF